MDDVENRQVSIKDTYRATASGWIGSALEYYDFFLYATAAALIFPDLFFPTVDPNTAIVAALATYGVGYIARPVGAVCLGHWGDRYGRKSVLLICMFLMGVSTIGIGLLPTYKTIGIWAPILLVVLRLMQGFAVAGEMSGAGSLILEQAPLGRRGFFASFTQVGSSFGQLLAALSFMPLAYFMPGEMFESWGWRMPFLLSFMVLVVGFMIRRHVRETVVFDEASRKKRLERSPVIEAFRSNWRNMVRVMFMSLNNVVPVVITVFGGAYAVNAAYGINITRESFLWVAVLSHGAGVLVMPFMGMVSDKIGRRPIMIAGILLSGAMTCLFLQAIAAGNLPLAIVWSIIGWGVIYQGFNAVYPAFYPELFPASVRVSAVAISNNIGVPVASLLAMVFALVAPPGTANIPLLIGGFAFAVTLLSGIAVWTCRETAFLDITALETSEKEKRPAISDGQVEARLAE